MEAVCAPFSFEAALGVLRCHGELIAVPHLRLHAVVANAELVRSVPSHTKGVVACRGELIAVPHLRLHAFECRVRLPAFLRPVLLGSFGHGRPVFKRELSSHECRTSP